MKNRSAALALTLIASTLVACAQPAKVTNMVPALTPSLMANQKSPLTNKVVIAAVTGGKTTNPMWTSEVGDAEFQQALEQSLQAAGLLAPAGAKETYQLRTQLKELEQPLVGLSMKVTAVANHQLQSPAGAEVLNKTLTTPYTAAFGDAFMGVERLRLANEGAIRENIKALIEELRKVR